MPPTRFAHRTTAAGLCAAVCAIFAACGGEPGDRRPIVCDEGLSAGDRLLDVTFEDGTVQPPYDEYVNEQGTGLDAVPQVVDSPVRNGERALRLELPGSDGAASRSQLQIPPEPAFRSGDEYWYGISLYIGEDWDLEQIDDDAERFAALFSFRWRDISSDANGPGGGIVLDRLDDGRPHFITRRETRGWEFADGGGSETIDLGPVVRGRWIDFVIHVKWSSTSEGALREYWRDGVLMGRSTKQNMGTDSPVINRMGLYQGSAVDHARTLYWDNHRIGDSYEEVDPGCPPRPDDEPS